MRMSRRRAVGTALLVALAVPAQGLVAPASAAYRATPAAGWSPDGTVFAVARVGTTVYLGGDFTSLTSSTGRTVARAHLAAVDARTGWLRSWNPGANGTVRALAAGRNGVVYAGGAFSRAASVPAGRLAAITASGRALRGWHASADRVVRDLLVQRTGVYAVGGFTRVNARSRSHVVRLSPTSGLVMTSFDAHVTGGSVYAIAASGTTLYLGGRFTGLSGARRVHSGAVTRDRGRVTSWRPSSQCGTCAVLDLVVDRTSVYQAMAGPGGRAAAFAKGSGRRTWVATSNGDAQAVTVRDQVVYVGGHFDTFRGVGRRQLAALRSSNGSVLGFSPRFSGSDHPGVWVVRADANALRIGGGSTFADSATARYAAFPTA